MYKVYLFSPALGSIGKRVYQDTLQVKGIINHNPIDYKKYSISKYIIQALSDEEEIKKSEIFLRRLQYSVFELKNSDRILNNILLNIEKKFKKRFEITDSILILKLCEGCKKKVIRYGFAVHEEEELVMM